MEQEIVNYASFCAQKKEHERQHSDQYHGSITALFTVDDWFEVHSDIVNMPSLTASHAPTWIAQNMVLYFQYNNILAVRFMGAESMCINKKRKNKAGLHAKPV